MIFPPLVPLPAYIAAFAILGAVAMEDWRDRRIKNSRLIWLSLFIVPVVLANLWTPNYIFLSFLLTAALAFAGYYKFLPPGDTKLFIAVSWLWPSVFWQLAFWSCILFQGIIARKKHALGVDILMAGLATVLIGSVLATALP
jgi:hypothetical protein